LGFAQLRPGAGADLARRALLDAVQAHGGTLLPVDQLSARVRAMVRQAQLALALLVAAAGPVAVLGVANAVLSSMAERRREIGLLRAAGATRRQVLRLILIELAGLGLLAALAGIALAWLATGLFILFARPVLGLDAWPGVPLLLASAAALLAWPALAMLAGLVPALAASRLPIVDALRA
jgi:ABC-type antimicrobial peptide transport system permease subunit